MHKYLKLFQPYAFKLFVGLYFILYHFQLSTEKYDNFFNLKCQLMVLLHNLYHIGLVLGPFILPNKKSAVIHLSLVILTFLSWKFNPIDEYKDRCMITILTNKVGGLPDKKGYKDLFWLFNIKNSKNAYMIYFTLIGLIDLYLIFTKNN